jgi:hypothetical protein
MKLEELDPSTWGFIYDLSEDEWNFGIYCLSLSTSGWLLTKFGEDHEDGELITFKSNSSDMTDYLNKMFRKNRLKKYLENDI